MHRTLDATAALLGIGPRKLRRRLRDLGVLDHAGDLTSTHRDKGRLFVDCRSRWNPSINGWSHYGVVMTTEAGVAWIAQQLGIEVRRMPPASATA